MLTEILVALVLLALGLAQVFTSAGMAARALSLSEGQGAALVVAQSVLAELGRSRRIADGVTQGDSGAEHWRLDVKTLPQDGGERGRGILEGHDAVLTVTWRENGRTRSLAFETLLLAAPKP